MVSLQKLRSCFWTGKHFRKLLIWGDNMKKAINRKVTSLALCGVLSFGLTVAPMARHSEAFGVLNAIGAIVGVSAQQIALNQQWTG